MVTAEEKTNAYGSRYVYYHCSKRRPDYRCRQPYVSASSISGSMEELLSRLVLPDELHQWTIREIETAAQDRASEKAQQILALEKACETVQRSQANLVTLRVRDLIDDAEFTRQRRSLQEEEMALKGRLRVAKEASDWFELARAVFTFSNRALSWYVEGDDRKKRQILRIVGSNFVLKDKNLSVQAEKPFQWAAEKSTCPVVRGLRDDVGINSEMSRGVTKSDTRGALQEMRALYHANDPEFMEAVAAVQVIISQHQVPHRNDSLLAA